MITHAVFTMAFYGSVLRPEQLAAFALTAWPYVPSLGAVEDAWLVMQPAGGEAPAAAAAAGAAGGQQEDAG